jgi:hypothetical protein
MSPAEMTALCGGIAAIVGSLSWLGGGISKEKRLYKENGYERRQDSITLTAHNECKKNRENQEKTLFTGQNRLFDGQNRLDDKIEKMREENRQDFKTVCEKIDHLPKINN